MSEYVNFHYMPLEGKITGKQVLKQTEDVINDLGEHVYELNIDESRIDEAVEKSEQAIETADAALSAVTTDRAVWKNTVAEMKETNIDLGVTAATRGEMVFNDGNGAFYGVRIEKSGDVDSDDTVFLDNGNVAERIQSMNIIAKGNNIIFVTNVAELIDSDALIGNVYGTTGYYSANDGGAGVYNIRAKVPGDVEDGGSIIFLSNGNVVAELITDGTVNVKQFGAVGDGVADDTTKLQNAINSNRKINLVQGTYRITSELNFQNLSNVEIYNGKIIHDVGTTHNTFRGKNCNNIYIHEIIFDANGNDPDITYTWQDNIQACCIFAPGCQQIFFTKNVVKNYNYGLFVLGADEDNTQEFATVVADISFNIFKNVKSCVDTYGKCFTIKGNYISDCNGCAIQTEPANSNVRTIDINDPLNDPNYYVNACCVDISDNYIIRSTGTIWCIIIHPKCLGVSVKNNTIIDFVRGISVNSAYCVTVSGNNLIKQKAQTYAGGVPTDYAPSLQCVGFYCKVDRNSFINVDVGMFAIGNNIYSNNRFDNIKLSAICTYISATSPGVPILKGNYITGMVVDPDMTSAFRPIYVNANTIIDSCVIITERPAIKQQRADSLKIYNTTVSPAFTESLTAITDVSTLEV